MEPVQLPLVIMGVRWWGSPAVERRGRRCNGIRTIALVRQRWPGRRQGCRCTLAGGSFGPPPSPVPAVPIQVWLRSAAQSWSRLFMYLDAGVYRR